MTNNELIELEHDEKKRKLQINRLKNAMKSGEVKMAAKKKPAKKRTAKQIAATKRLVAANKKKRGGKKKAAKRKGPTKFQKYLLTHPAEAKKKMGW